jgi:acetylornithine deacetylase
MDTMPVGTLEKWDRKSPFGLYEKQGKLYGLGSVDMKGPIAAMICAIEPLMKDAAHLKRELVFGLTYDEENGLRGARRMVTANMIRPKFVLIAEPTMLLPMRMHKGHICLRATCYGQKAHAAKPNEGINAIELAGDVIEELKRFSEELMGVREPDIDPSYATLNISSIASFDRSHERAKSNEVPNFCTVDFAIRPIPGQSAEQIRADITERIVDRARHYRNRRHHSSITVELQIRTKTPTEPMFTSPDSELVKVTEKVSNRKAMGACYSTDASVLQKLGSECVIFGPGSIDVAHKENEHIETSQLLAGVTQIREIVKQMCFGRKP